MSWPWSSSSSASSSNTRTPLVPPQFDTAAEAGSSAGPSKQASLNLATSDLTASPIPEESPSVGSRVSEASGSVNRYERILKDEEKYQAKQYPTFEEVPGCMQLFDEFMMCYALVPQLRSFYRRGDFHDCSWKFRDFKYCLSLKSEPEDRKVELWTKRRAEWWAGRRFEGSSEDVWDVREKPPANFPPVETDPEALPDQSSEKVVS